MNDIYSALITRLTSANIAYIDQSDIAYDNNEFDPSGKDAWLNTSFVPVERTTESKDTTGNVDTGFFQIDVFVPLHDTTGGVKQYNLRALEIMQDVLQAFAENTKLTFNTTKVMITNSTFAAPLPSESWYQIPITVNYRRV